MACVGKDKQGNILFIHCRSPYSVHTFIDILLAAPLDIYNMMYLEGGAEASLYMNHNGFKIGQMGSYETGFIQDDNQRSFWKMPNIIGITKK